MKPKHFLWACALNIGFTSSVLGQNPAPAAAKGFSHQGLDMSREIVTLSDSVLEKLYLDNVDFVSIKIEQAKKSSLAHDLADGLDDDDANVLKKKKTILVAGVVDDTTQQVSGVHIIYLAVQDKNYDGKIEPGEILFVANAYDTTQEGTIIRTMDVQSSNDAYHSKIVVQDDRIVAKIQTKNNP